MNSKRNKHKNKSKPFKVSPPQQEKDNVEIIHETPINKIIVESEQKDQSEKNPHTTIEMKSSESDLPAKPKRNKGKQQNSNLLTSCKELINECSISEKTGKNPKNVDIHTDKNEKVTVVLSNIGEVSPKFEIAINETKVSINQNKVEGDIKMSNKKSKKKKSRKEIENIDLGEKIFCAEELPQTLETSGYEIDKNKTQFINNDTNTTKITEGVIDCGQVVKGESYGLQNTENFNKNHNSDKKKQRKVKDRQVFDKDNITNQEQHIVSVFEQEKKNVIEVFEANLKSETDSTINTNDLSVEPNVALQDEEDNIKNPTFVESTVTEKSTEMELKSIILVSDKNIRTEKQRLKEQKEIISKKAENKSDIIKENTIPENEMTLKHSCEGTNVNKDEELDNSYEIININTNVKRVHKNDLLITEHPSSNTKHNVDPNNDPTLETKLAETVKSQSLLLVDSKENFIQTNKQSTPGNDYVLSKELGGTRDNSNSLKNRVMQVNRDLEGLKNTIELSVAEFSGQKIKKEMREKGRNNKSEIRTPPVKDTTIVQEKDSVSFQINNQNKIHKISLDRSKLRLDDFATIKDKEEKIETNIELKNINTELNSQNCLLQNPPKTSFEEKALKSSAKDETTPVCPPRKDNKAKNKQKGKKELHVVGTLQATSLQGSNPQNLSEKSIKVDSISTPKTNNKEKEQSPCQDNDSKLVDAELRVIELSKCVEISEIINKATVNKVNDTNEDLKECVLLESTSENYNHSLTLVDENSGNHSEKMANEIKPNDRLLNKRIVESSLDLTKYRDDKKIDSLVPQSKNLLDHPIIPVSSSKIDYKKEKNKMPNARAAKVKVKGSRNIENYKKLKLSKESQTDSKRDLIDKTVYPVKETISCVINGNEELVYKYSFRKVYLPNACQFCKEDFKSGIRLPCNFCNLIFYCSEKHIEEDRPCHESFCFAVSTIKHLKEQEYLYSDVKNITGYNYRLLRMQMIVSCEKVLKRKLIPWEQEALLYPRMCADVRCREWDNNKLIDCAGCGQVSYCSAYPEHFPKSHQRWCKSYSLYQKLVCYQQTNGRLEPKLPRKVMQHPYVIPENMNQVLAAMYEEKIDMNEMQYATLTQLATGPLTAAYCYQTCNNNCFTKDKTFVLHIIGAELQFEADTLNKWEVFFLHLVPQVQELKIVLVSPELNPNKLPLDILGKINVCGNCNENKRRVTFDFQDNKYYHQYTSSEKFTYPDLVCAFNPSVQRYSAYDDKDPWPATINCIIKLKAPFVVTSCTMEELNRDLSRIKECTGNEFKVISNPKCNSFASVRPDRNFISDDEVPLLFKNYCYFVICGI